MLCFEDDTESFEYIQNFPFSLLVKVTSVTLFGAYYAFTLGFLHILIFTLQEKEK